MGIDLRFKFPHYFIERIGFVSLVHAIYCHGIAGNFAAQRFIQHTGFVAINIKMEHIISGFKPGYKRFTLNGFRHTGQCDRGDINAV